METKDAIAATSRGLRRDHRRTNPRYSTSSVTTSQVPATAKFESDAPIRSKPDLPSLSTGVAFSHRVQSQRYLSPQAIKTNTGRTIAPYCKLLVVCPPVTKSGTSTEKRTQLQKANLVTITVLRTVHSENTLFNHSEFSE